MGCHLRADDALNWDHRIQKEVRRAGIDEYTWLEGPRVRRFVYSLRQGYDFFVYLSFICTCMHIYSCSRNEEFKAMPCLQEEPANTASI